MMNFDEDITHDDLLTIVDILEEEGELQTFDVKGIFFFISEQSVESYMNSQSLVT